MFKIKESKMKVTRIKKLMISGISVVTNNEIEMSEEDGQIAKLWEEYFSKDIYKTTFDKANNDSMYSVYSDYVSDVTGNYKVTVGVEVTKPKNAVVIEDKKYLVFTKQGELPYVVVELWEEIWEYFEKNSDYERAFTIDFEKYAKEDEVEIYVSIK
jgi:predicted transcriptional regulator YdeE